MLLFATWQKAKKGNAIICNMAVAWFGEGNGTPLQYSCLENPMDRGAW